MTERNDISSRTCEIAQAVETAQRAMFDAAAREHGLTLKVLEAATGISINTLRTYAPSKATTPACAMPVHVFLKLARVIPNELTSLMLDPGGKAVGDAEPEETDLDDAAIAALEYALRWAKSRHPDSSSGVKIDHTEKPGLHLAAAGLQDRVGKVA